MKDQYNFIKTIDHMPTSVTSSSSNNNNNISSQEDKKICQQQPGNLNRPLPVKSSFTKLHNLVASKFGQQTGVQQQQQQVTAPQPPSATGQQQNNLNQIKSQPAQRNARVFSLSSATNIANSSNRKLPVADEQEKQPLVAKSQQQTRTPFRDPASLERPAPSTTTTTTTNTTTSEKMTPELARCYDEIDQIYDYIRGLAPLPLQLRKIKSIDFEQLERENRLREQQQQQLSGKLLSNTTATCDSVAAPKVRSKVRQRDASDGGELPKLRDPLHPQQQQTIGTQRVQGPLPIKVTATTCESRRPNVKRVESLNLGSGGELRSSNSSHATGQPPYMASSSKRGQLFRLPRAHSTSTLNKPAAVNRQQKAVGGPHNQHAAAAQLAQQTIKTSPLTTHTLPGLRLSRVSVLEPLGGQSASLNRMTKQPTEATRRERLASGSSSSAHKLAPAQHLHRQTPNGSGKALDLVESFVDDDDVSSVASRTSSISTSSSEATSTPSSSTDHLSVRHSKASRRSADSSETSDSNSSNSSSESESGTTSTESPTTSSSESQSANQEGRGRKHSRSRAVKENWGAEKSHSDYENDTVSCLTSDSPSDLLSPSSSRSRRRSSSGAGTGTTGSQQERLGSHSSAGSSVARDTPLKQRSTTSSSVPHSSTTTRAGGHDNEADNDKAADEHIYEQIPAHKSLLIGLKPNAPQPLAPQLSQQPTQNSQTRTQSQQHPVKQPTSNNQFGTTNGNSQMHRIHQFPHHQQLQPPFNYPVAYAPNVAPPKQQVATYMAVTPSAHHNLAAAAIHQRHQYLQQASGGTYPPVPVGVRSICAPPPQARALDHRHRLSMSNLHLLPYLKHPLLGLCPQAPDQHQAAVAAASAAAAKLSRSSSSSKVNRLRAPRLSPAQLIAQIQMPRAVSKRQLQPSAEFTASNRQYQSSENHQQQQRNLAHHQQHLSNMFLWQRPSQQQPQASQSSLQRALPPQNYRAYGNQQLDGASRSKRNSSRRLTAIGIEEALECVRQVPLATAPVQLRKPLTESHRLEDRRSFEGGHRRTASASYFEPAQLLKGAPLIDDDEVGEDDDDETTGSDESPQKSKNMSSKQPAFSQNRCLNSISDLHSFSSTSSAEEEDDNQDGGDSSAPSSSESLVGRRNRNKFSRGRAISQDRKSRDEGNFVSSNSFIKCYYGRERRPSESTTRSDKHQPEKPRRGEVISGSNEPPAAQVPAKEVEQQRPARSKKRGSEKLLGLIGLNTGSSRRTASNQQVARNSKSGGSGSESSAAIQQQRASVASSPMAALFAAAKRSTNSNKRSHNQPELVGEFLNAEGPILVRDRRIAALRSDLVRHYEHPTVKVTSVPSYEQRVQHKLRQQQQQHESRTSGQADSRALHRRFVSMLNQNGSTNTTNSTSSYEAAIKNSRTASLTPLPPEEPTEQHPVAAPRASGSTKKSSTSGSGLIKVPKLSKQSHLLNRPLPKPPTQPSSSGGSSRHAAARALSNGAAASLSGSTSSSHRQQQQPGSLSKRKLLLATNLSATRLLAHSISNLPEQRVSATDSQPKRPARRSANGVPPGPYSTGGGGGGSSSSSGGGGATNSNNNRSSSLYPALQVSTVMGTTQPSPTVTTCTSSGISSRLTSGTHLASGGGSSGSSQRSASVSQQQRVKSLSELHKQSKQLRLAAAAAKCSSGDALPDSRTPAKDSRSPDFALMDESDERDEGSGLDPLYTKNNSAEPPQPEVEKKHNPTSMSHRLARGKLEQVSGDIVSDEDIVGNDDDGEALNSTKTDRGSMMTSNLRLFDERFSSKFVDKQLASSNDSLLESINFSGTLNGKLQTQMPAGAAKR